MKKESPILIAAIICLIVGLLVAQNKKREISKFIASKITSWQKEKYETETKEEREREESKKKQVQLLQFNSSIELAKRGDPEGQFNTGVCYFKGIGVEQNTEEALHWWRKSAELGSTKAQYRLGDFYSNSIGERRDMTNAMTWYKMAAFQGDAVALFRVGQLYRLGESLHVDKIESFAFLTLAERFDGQIMEKMSKEWWNRDSPKDKAGLAQEFLTDKIFYTEEIRTLGKKRADELQKDIMAKIVAKKVMK